MVIVGISGSGKSMLLKLMLNVYQLVEGVVCFGEVKIDNFQYCFWCECCGVVLQDGYIFNDIIVCNIVFGDEVIDKCCLLCVVKVVNIQLFIEGFFLGYSIWVGKDGFGLSLGEW